ncbi:MAG: glycosyltransferase family 39 protein [Candidatus Paceibacterota bacterium]
MKNRYFLLFLIIIVASFFRLYNLSETPPGLYPDEAMNGNNALEANATGDYKIFYPENNGREGLFINIQAGFLKLLPNTAETLRLPSAIFGILTVLGLYLLVKELLIKKNRHEKETIALLSSFFMAISFWHINFSRIGFRAIIAPFFAVFALYFFLKAVQLPENARRKAYFLSALGGIFFGLGFYSYIAYRVLPLLFLLFIPFFYKNRQFWKFTLVFIFFTILLAAPLGIYFLNNPQDFLGRTSQVSIFTSASPTKLLTENVLKTFGMFNFVGDFNWRHNFSGSPLLYWPIGILFLIGLFISIFHFIASCPPFNKSGVQSRFPFSIIFSWFILASLPVIVSSEGLPHALRAILMAPSVFIFSAIGGEFIFRKLKEFSPVFRKISFFLAFVFFLLLILNSYQRYFFEWANNKNTKDAFSSDYAEIGNIINSLPQKEKKYVIVENNGVLVRGIPMPSQTIMFITDTFTPEKQKEKNIFYILLEKEKSIPQDAKYVFKI